MVARDQEEGCMLLVGKKGSIFVLVISIDAVFYLRMSYLEYLRSITAY